MSSSMVSRIRASSKVRNISKSSCFICIDASDAGDYIAARCHNSFLAMRVSLVIDNLLIHRHGLSRLHLYKSDFGSATPASSFVSVHPSAFLLASAAAAHTAIASSSLIARVMRLCCQMMYVTPKKGCTTGMSSEQRMVVKRLPFL